MAINSAIPILIVHKGNQEYLKICLKQAHYSNPNSRIILLGDKSNCNCLPFVEWYSIYDYYDEASNFEKIYKHYSCNKFDYERFAFAKWFAINDFMKKNKLERLFVNDSDVLIFTNFAEDDEHNKAMNDYDFTVSKPHGQETMFFNNQESLQKFCDFIKGIFLDKDLMKRIDAISKMPDWCRIPFGNPKTQDVEDLIIDNWDFSDHPLSDMTALQWFVQSTNLRIFDYGNYDIDNKIVNISSDDIEYRLNGKLMNIEYINKLPFAYNKILDKNVQMHTLHFQGWKKELMANYATYDKDDSFNQPSFTIWQLLKIYDIQYKIKKRRAERIIKLFCKYLFK